ncbi:hypothetical protein D3C76_1695240 [compost metagenome]
MMGRINSEYSCQSLRNKVAAVRNLLSLRKDVMINVVLAVSDSMCFHSDPGLDK